MTRDEVIAQVRALLELNTSRGATEHEAQNAARAAQRLMQAWRIEEAELRPPDLVRRVLYASPARRSPWDTILLLVACEMNGVRCVRSSRRYSPHFTQHRAELVGATSDVLFVTYLYEFLRAEVHRLVMRATAAGECRGREGIKRYRLGVVHGICEMLKEKPSVDAPRAMVLVDQRLSAADAFLGATPREFRVSGVSSVLGVRAGRAVRVRMPLEKHPAEA